MFSTNLSFSLYWFLQLAAVHVFSFYQFLLLYYAIEAIELMTGETLN